MSCRTSHQPVGAREESAAATSLTFGHYTQTTPWTDRRVMAWPDLCALLTKHQIGPKAGTCFCPAVFRGDRRHKNDADQIDVAFLDSDSGATLEEIRSAVAAKGWRAIISSTHGHLTRTTSCKRRNWDEYRAEHGDDAAGYLIADKGYLPRVAEGAVVASETGDMVTFRHQPCPKFRVVIPLARPWRAADYPSQKAANAAWRDQIEAVAAALHLSHDQSCTDTSRLFFLPRRPADGPAPETAVLEGAPCDIFALPAPGVAPGRRRRASASHRLEVQDVVDPETGEVFDLARWARGNAGRFQIVSALRARHPGAFVGKVADGKHHLRCVNASAHTSAADDQATFAMNASDATSGHFVIHCRHSHCADHDHLAFLKQMIEERWLSVGNLSDPAFLTDGSDSAVDGQVELTEHGVALAFAQRHGEDLRYCHTSGCWYLWDGVRWVRDQTRRAFNWARHLVASLNRDAEFKTQAITGKASFATAVERFAQADEAVAVTAEIWDADPLLLGTPGGVVDLRTGTIRPGARTDYITRITAVAPAATADCPTFLDFLRQATAGDTALIAFLQRWFGYCLTGITREHALLFVYGPGGNGKGVLLVTVSGILGSYAVTAALDTFTASTGDRHPTDLAMLAGARLVMTTETEEGRAWAEARIKAMTGGDPVTARFMRQDFFTYIPDFKLTISGNHKPALRNVDDAARRRFNVVPFLHRPAAPDPELTDKLRKEWPGILRWMIEGCLAWQRGGLQRPKAVLDATAEYFAEQDLLTQWLEERCEIGAGFGEPSGRLFASWRAFALERSDDPRNAKWLGSMLERQGYRRAKDCARFRGRGYLGIRLLPEPAARPWTETDA